MVSSGGRVTELSDREELSYRILILEQRFEAYHRLCEAECEEMRRLIEDLRVDVLRNGRLPITDANVPLAEPFREWREPKEEGGY